MSLPVHYGGQVLLCRRARNSSIVGKTDYFRFAEWPFKIMNTIRHSATRMREPTCNNNGGSPKATNLLFSRRISHDKTSCLSTQDTTETHLCTLGHSSTSMEIWAPYNRPFVAVSVR
ncbi:hypothetical protein M513_13699 [Trichuris suis]|uniref:Uncharacterized protein n=1 Tax=Trichuris suis TaxID=68888 RepID=A0A085LKC5_9BILA|nr:hypothetical protein M513_13699 [Trichuris suis]